MLVSQFFFLNATFLGERQIIYRLSQAFQGKSCRYFLLADFYDSGMHACRFYFQSSGRSPTPRRICGVFMPMLRNLFTDVVVPPAKLSPFAANAEESLGSATYHHSRRGVD